VRITTQLIDASSAANLWADHFEAELDDIFALQDQVTRSIVGAIAPKLEQAEIAYGNRKPTESLTAFDYYLRGKAYLYRATQSGSSQALQLFNKALEVDPQFASAYGMAALCYIQRKYFGWMSDPVKEMTEAARLARRAVTLGGDDPVSLCAGGFTLAQSPGQLETGVTLIDRALALDSNQATAWFLRGWATIHLGQPEAAIESFSRALRLNPLDPLIFAVQTGTAAAYFLAGHYDEASSWAERAVRERPSFPAQLRIAAASHALAGRLAEAQKAVARFRELDPEFRVSDIEAVAPFRQSEAVARYIDGLRKAGLPE
jgi:tetratricopeptide (TPR) repeat protein